MKFSAKGRYAVRAMIDLALHFSDKPISAKSIAERQDFSADYLEQIFRLLRKRGLVKSVRGPAGGFILTRPPEEITIWDIIVAIDEPLSIAPCVEDGIAEKKQDCRRLEFCAAHLLWGKLGKNIRNLMQQTTLESIVSDARGQLSGQPLHSHDFHI